MEETNEKDREDMERNFPNYVKDTESKKEEKRDILSGIRSLFSDENSPHKTEEKNPIIPSGITGKAETKISVEIAIPKEIFKRKRRSKNSKYHEKVLRKNKKARDKQFWEELKKDPARYEEWKKKKREDYAERKKDPAYVEKLRKRSREYYHTHKRSERGKVYQREYYKRQKETGNERPDMTGWDKGLDPIRIKRLPVPIREMTPEQKREYYRKWYIKRKRKKVKQYTRTLSWREKKRQDYDEKNRADKLEPYIPTSMKPYIPKKKLSKGEKIAESWKRRKADPILMEKWLKAWKEGHSQRYSEESVKKFEESHVSEDGCVHLWQELITCIVCRKCGKVIKK